MLSQYLIARAGRGVDLLVTLSRQNVRYRTPPGHKDDH